MVGVGVVLVGTCAVAQVANPDSGGTKRPMTFADMMAMKRVSDPQISPSGKWVMFSVTDVSLEKNTKVNHLWIVPLAGGGERQVTFGDGESSGRFSPDGRWVSLSMKDQIYRMPWDDAAGSVGAAVQVTNVAGGADGAEWAPDSKRLMFVSSVYPECSVMGGGATPTHRDGAAMNGALNVGAEAATWAEEDACDKARDDAAAKSPVKAQVWDGLLYRHWDHYTGEKRSHVLVVDADGSGVRDLTPASVVGDAETPTFSLGGPLGYAWAPDSKEIAYVTNLDKVPAASTNNDVFTLRLDEPGAKAVKVSTSLGSDDGPAYSPDGKWLAFRSQARAGYESDRFRLMLFDREKKTTRELMPKFDRWVDELVWSPNSEKIYFVSGSEGAAPLFSIQIDRHNLFMEAAEEIPLKSELRGEFSEIQLSPNSGTAVATFMRADGPAELCRVTNLGGVSEGTVWRNYAAGANGKIDLPQNLRGELVPRATGLAEPLTHLNAALTDRLELPDMESYQFAGAEGTKVQGFIVRPPNFDAAKKYPVKFLIHGGPQGAWGDSWSYRWNAELMAASGYVVVMVNPRGSTGYGQAFIDGVNGDWGGKAYVDLMRGLDAAEAKFPFIDKTRECALGGSFGGYMADWVLTHTDRFKCIVTHDGLYDAESAYGATEEMWFNEWEFRRGPATGAAVWDKEPAQPWRYSSLPADEDPFRKWSPMRYIKNAKTPTLVIHSQKDYRLDVSQGFELFTALQRLGVPSKMLYFPDEGHWVLKPQNSQLWYETVGDWCDRWTKSGK
jgi:dipeptidyl aminopeptidase/acylaminoacyl peptidase